MIYTDKEIAKKGQEIIEGFDKDNINPVSYDLTVGAIVGSDGEVSSYELKPDEMIFIRTAEKIHMPNDLMGRIGEKNSRMRQGLWVSGPHYFPGHTTYMFLRVKNISQNIITLAKGQKIAQIYFEELDGTPEKTYDKQENASFNDETSYRGFGNYESDYDKEIKQVQKEKDSLEKLQGRLYANILTLMGILVSIFSLIMVNFSQLSGGIVSKKMLLTINFSLGFVIAVFMGLIFLFINKNEIRKKSLILWIVLVIVLLIAVILV